VFRSTPKELVFAQALFGLELAAADPRVVAINLVGEEDEHTSMSDYAEHMRMVGFLRELYPNIRVYEDRPYELLKNMADKGVLVEINLTSNDDILGVSGKHHPFETYRSYGVPVALSTDDPGIERIDLTHEYVRAVETYGLSHADLKELVRNSIEYSFLPGASLWDDKGGYARFVVDCLNEVPGKAEPTPPCAAFLGKSEKAAQQWELQRRFRDFEASL